MVAQLARWHAWPPVNWLVRFFEGIVNLTVSIRKSPNPERIFMQQTDFGQRFAKTQNYG
jgi:hypothetical protein